MNDKAQSRREFDPRGCGPAFAALLAPPRLAPLGPGTPNEAARGLLQELTLERAFEPGRIVDPDMARACLAGIWLYHDFLDESHTISQQIHTPTGSYWHAIMHRREPDASNSKYWMRRVGDHPVLAQLREQASALAYPYTDPFAFIDLVERVRGTGSKDEEGAKRVQQLEWELLFGHCLRAAVSL